MSALSISAVVLACLLAASTGGMALRAVLPSHHLNQDSTDVIKLATGLMATLAALVLGLLVSSANTTHNLVESEYNQSLANVVLLDQYLAEYGPDADESRALLRRLLIGKFRATWPDEDFGSEQPASADSQATAETLERQILLLSPRSELQKWYLSRALQITSELRQVRWLLFSQEVGNRLPPLSLSILVAWTAAIFTSFGLFARPNPTVLASLFVSAAAVAGAILLILELDSPFSGLIRIPSASAHAMLALLGT